MPGMPRLFTASFSRAGDVAGEVDELLAARQARPDDFEVEARQHLLQLRGRLVDVHHLLRVGVQARRRQRHRQDLAVAVHDHRPGARPGVGRQRRLRDRRGGNRVRAGRGRRGRGGVRQARPFDPLGRHRHDHGGAGELDRDGAEQHGEAARGKQQPAARALQHGAAGKLRRVEPHVHRRGGAVRHARASEPDAGGRRVRVRRGWVGGVAQREPVSAGRRRTAPGLATKRARRRRVRCRIRRPPG